MITNQSSQSIRPEWSDDLQTYVIYAENLADCVDGELGLIREGSQSFAHNVSSITTIENSCNPADCALKDAEILFFDTLS